MSISALGGNLPKLLSIIFYLLSKKAPQWGQAEFLSGVHTGGYAVTPQKGGDSYG